MICYKCKFENCCKCDIQICIYNCVNHLEQFFKKISIDIHDRDGYYLYYCKDCWENLNNKSVLKYLFIIFYTIYNKIISMSYKKAG